LNTQLRKYPPAQDGANHSQDNIHQAAKSAPAADFPRKPSRDQSNEYPHQEGLSYDYSKEIVRRWRYQHLNTSTFAIFNRRGPR
jgi:hypothetical protein